MSDQLRAILEPHLGSSSVELFQVMKEIDNLYRQHDKARYVEALRKARLNPHENVAGCLFTAGTQKQSDADIAAIEGVDDE